MRAGGSWVEVGVQLAGDGGGGLAVGCVIPDEPLRRGLKWLAKECPHHPPLLPVLARDVVLKRLGRVSEEEVEGMGPGECVALFNGAVEEAREEVRAGAGGSVEGWPPPELDRWQGQVAQRGLPPPGWNRGEVVEGVMEALENVKLPPFRETSDHRLLPSGQRKGARLEEQAERAWRSLSRYLAAVGRRKEGALAEQREAEVLLRYSCSVARGGGGEGVLTVCWGRIFLSLFQKQLSKLLGASPLVVYVSPSGEGAEQGGEGDGCIGWEVVFEADRIPVKRNTRVALDEILQEEERAGAGGWGGWGATGLTPGEQRAMMWEKRKQEGAAHVAESPQKLRRLKEKEDLRQKGRAGGLQGLTEEEEEEVEEGQRHGRQLVEAAELDELRQVAAEVRQGVMFMLGGEEVEMEPTDAEVAMSRMVEEMDVRAVERNRCFEMEESGGSYGCSPDREQSIWDGVTGGKVGGRGDDAAYSQAHAHTNGWTALIPSGRAAGEWMKDRFELLLQQHQGIHAALQEVAKLWA